MPTMGETDLFDPQATAPNRVEGFVTILIGGSGAVTSVTGMPGVTCVRTGTGTYNLTYNRAPDVILQYGIQLSSTVAQIRGTARSSTAGTASFATLSAAGAAADPASGDQLTINFWARVRGNL